MDTKHAKHTHKNKWDVEHENKRNEMEWNLELLKQVSLAVKPGWGGIVYKGRGQDNVSNNFFCTTRYPPVFGRFLSSRTPASTVPKWA